MIEGIVGAIAAWWLIGMIGTLIMWSWYQSIYDAEIARLSAFEWIVPALCGPVNFIIVLVLIRTHNRSIRKHQAGE